MPYILLSELKKGELLFVGSEYWRKDSYSRVESTFQPRNKKNTVRTYYAIITKKLNLVEQLPEPIHEIIGLNSLPDPKLLEKQHDAYFNYTFIEKKKSVLKYFVKIGNRLFLITLKPKPIKKVAGKRYLI